MKTCLWCKAEGCFGYVRGLCPTCYDKTRHMVKRGLTTWEKRERLGKSLPADESRQPGKGCGR